GWLGCRRVGRLRPAFVGWGLRGPDGLTGRRGLLPARLLGWCRGRVGVGLWAWSKWLVISGQQELRAALEWTAEDGCPHTIQYLRHSISGLLCGFRFAFDVLYFLYSYFRDA